MNRLNHSEHPEYGGGCTDTRSRLYLRSVPAGTVWFCHNCGAGGIKRNTKLTPSEILKRAKQSVIPSTAGTYKTIRLPSDFSLKIPTEGLKWFFKYGIYLEEIERYRFGYSDYNNRLILPVYNDDALVYFQARTLGTPSKTNPKYLNVKLSGAKNVFFKVLSNPVSKSVVIVEDILSSIKVGRVENSIALLGSYVPTSLTEICNHFDTIILWLDRDKLKSSLKYCQTLQARTGKQVKIVMVDKDPKEYSNDEIKNILKPYLNISGDNHGC